MNNKILTATVFISSLILSPVAMPQLNASTKIKHNSIASTISNTLYKRGLEKGAAKKITKQMVGENEDLFNMMATNLTNGCKAISQNEVIEYLSKSALFKERVQLDSYSFLVSMVHQIKSQAPSKTTLNELKKISQKNSFYS